LGRTVARQFYSNYEPQKEERRKDTDKAWQLEADDQGKAAACQTTSAALVERYNGTGPARGKRGGVSASAVKKMVKCVNRRKRRRFKKKEGFEKWGVGGVK